MTQVIRTFVPNSMANYNHLVVCLQTKATAAVDPFDAGHLMTLAKTNGLNISHIWITHEHGDHIRDAEKLKALTGAQLYAPSTCKGHVNADYWLEDQQSFQLGRQTIHHWLTPGHIPGHGIYFTKPSEHTPAFIMAGDTLFNAGVGNVKSGDVIELFHSVQRIVKGLHPSSQLYCGHDYSETNLKFVLNHLPNCKAAHQALKICQTETPETRSIKSLADELHYNPFLAVGAHWLNECPKLANLAALDQFIALRKLRDQW